MDTSATLPPRIFDRRLVRLRRDRAASGRLPPLWDEAADRLLERLDDVRRTFDSALDLGCRDGRIARGLADRGIEVRAALDLSTRFAHGVRRSGLPVVVGDEEALPFAPRSFDLIVGCLSLHWVNDLPGALLQLRRALRPDGLLLVSLAGLGSLERLRSAFAAAEIENRGGVSPRISPFAALSDLAGLLQRAGFALPVADLDRVRVLYAGALDLLHDLRAMGEGNALVERDRRPLARSVFASALASYAQSAATTEGRIEAEFVLLTATGWAPSDAQPRPLAPGSATVRLADALGALNERGGARSH